MFDVDIILSQMREIYGKSYEMPRYRAALRNALGISPLMKSEWVGQEEYVEGYHAALADVRRSIATAMVSSQGDQ